MKYGNGLICTIQRVSTIFSMRMGCKERMVFMKTIMIYWISGHIDIEYNVPQSRIDRLKQSKSVIKIEVLK